MALASKSIDEATKELADIYDGYISPMKIKRNHNNKLYLALRAFAAGMVTIIDSALSLRNRFNPAYCDPADLYSTCKIVGTELKEGSPSILQITILNKSNASSKTLYAGEYSYIAASGMEFLFGLENNYLFDPGEPITVFALSREKGSYYVTTNSPIKVTRKDSASINASLQFSCADNASSLGYLDETEDELRQRLIGETDRQDHLKELELKIKNLPNIFECNLVFNAGENSSIYDGIAFGPRELLINITGQPSNAIAELVAGEVLYPTCQVDPNLVVYYKNDLYIDGQYPVYYRCHSTMNFSLSINYQYDKRIVKPAQAEPAIAKLFEEFTRPVRHVDIVSRSMVYRMLQALELSGVTILNAELFYETEQVSFIRIPKTRLPFLEELTFVAEELVLGG